MFKFSAKLLLSLLCGFGSVLSTGIQAQSNLDEYNAPLGAIDKYGIDWVTEDDGSVVVRAEIAIDAPGSIVWELVRDPNNYETFSEVLSASVSVMEAGAPIQLSIQLFDGLPPTTSDEFIGVFDDEARGVSWIRDFGFDQYTDRWQVVEDEGTGSRYYTALKFPDSIGWLIKITAAGKIEAAFNQFADELRNEAEFRARTAF